MIGVRGFHRILGCFLHLSSHVRFCAWTKGVFVQGFEDFSVAFTDSPAEPFLKSWLGGSRVRRVRLQVALPGVLKPKK